ncbi:MAG TPA: deoxynucleoside kinase [Quisquiliibacterium sp.]|nr:deoxynucleoside kinase [Quisquiliibacterium sp.]HPA89418.1 deoxynucleoside kinase [Quisquiliibacterium sp.]HQD82728.1 deoxynucleoside kinase [Quisquiliibacterium sp.]HQN13447.1 deoxynucleoside kinase [Quisquiliibacterium sp.]HQP65538.1 deoxynucleoside kinase [Quisquiliibacterium sp.]
MNPIPSPFERYRHIVVEGPIGVGKTSLARKLAERFGTQLVLEEAGSNPFLERFYRDGRRYALPTQLFFLFQRVNQLRDLGQRDLFTQTVTGDFLLDKDPLFARLTLDDDELGLYQQIFDSMRPQAPVPDLVIYLQAQPDTLVERVRKRGVAMEADISESYLRALADAYSRYFYNYEASPLMIVNTEHLNPIDRDEDFLLLMRQLGEMRGRRVFFNRAD